MKGFTREVRLRDRENNYRWFLVNAEPLKGDDENVNKWVGTCLDIDDQKTQLQKRDEFISIASHELKTPVTSLKGALQLLSRSIAREQGLSGLQPLLEMANRSMGQISMLIDDLLNTQRIQHGHIQLNLKQIEIIAFLKASAIEHNNSPGPQVIVSNDSPINTTADAFRIEQVLSNLITNAKKYAPNSPVIEITVKTSGANLRIEVKDEGPGIPEEKLLYLFERYYRADKEGRQYSGLGLGLYVSAEIIQRHGGEIGVESLIGKGSTFWFTLPKGLE